MIIEAGERQYELVEGWGELLCMLAGLPPTPEGVSLLTPRRADRA